MQLEPAGLDLRQVEDVVDDRQQVQAAVVDVLGELPVARGAERPEHARCCMISEKPRTALSGVRSSWLMLARNSDLARLARSAWSRAATSACSVCLRSVMSRSEATKPPPGSGLRRSSATRPSGSVTSVGAVSPRRAAARCAAIASSRAGPAASWSARWRSSSISGRPGWRKPSGNSWIAAKAGFQAMSLRSRSKTPMPSAMALSVVVCWSRRCWLWRRDRSIWPRTMKDSRPMTTKAMPSGSSEAAEHRPPGTVGPPVQRGHQAAVRPGQGQLGAAGRRADRPQPEVGQAAVGRQEAERRRVERLGEDQNAQGPRHGEMRRVRIVGRIRDDGLDGDEVRYAIDRHQAVHRQGITDRRGAFGDDQLVQAGTRPGRQIEVDLLAADIGEDDLAPRVDHQAGGNVERVVGIGPENS